MNAQTLGIAGDGRGAVKFGRLSFIEKTPDKTADGRFLSRWLCDCGNEHLTPFGRAKSGAIRSCGCLVLEASTAAHKTHGGRHTSEYSSWMAMRRRCENTTDKDYWRYGGSGVHVCAEWSKDFGAFREHIGARPIGTTLDRIDSRRGYEPGNVRWATLRQQARNRRGSYVWSIKGLSFESIGEAAQHFGVSENTVSRWVNGAFDKRRGTKILPRTDCSVVARYS